MRKSYLPVAAAFLFVSAVSVAPPIAASHPASAREWQAGVSPAAEVPISKEHHHHLILENSYVKAYEVEVPAHESTLLHRHDFDYVYVVLGDADVTNAVLGKPELKLHLPDLTVNFSPGPFAHVAGNVGDAPFRNFTISLLRKQGELKTYFPTVDAALEDAAKAANAAGARDILETNELRVSAIKVAPGSNWTPAKSKGPRLFMLVDRMRDLAGPKEPKAPTFPEGMLVWVPGGKRWTLVNDSSHEMKLVWMEFKN